MPSSTGIRSDLLITPVWPSLLEPVVPMVERLLACNGRAPNAVKASEPENGLACGVILLCAVIVESALGRVEFVARRRRANSTAADNAALAMATSGKRWKVKRAISHQLPGTCLAVREVMILRDCIAHGFLWAGEVSPTGPLRWRTRPALAGGFGGSTDFATLVDIEHCRTHPRRLNVVPIRMWRRDAFSAFQTMVAAIDEMHRDDPLKPLATASGHPPFLGRVLTLAEIAAELPDLDDPEPSEP